MQVLSTCLVSLALFANGARVQTPNKGHDMPAFNLPGAGGAARAKSRTLEPEMVDKQRRSAAGLALAATMLGMVPKADAGPFTRQDLGYHSCCLLYTSPSPRDQRGSRMPSSA